MTVTYRTIDRQLSTPETSKEQLIDYHDLISDRVDVDVIGVAGDGQSIRRVVLSDKTDLSALESWLGSQLVVEG